MMRQQSTVSGQMPDTQTTDIRMTDNRQTDDSRTDKQTTKGKLEASV